MHDNIISFCSVVVTYNRLDKLKKAIESYNNQTYPISEMVVVNNASTDGTKAFLEKIQNSCAFKMHIINTNENLGGAGGFAVGIEYASTLPYDYVFIADDDAYLDKNAIKEIRKEIDLNDKCGAFCSRVIFPDKEIQTLHRRIIKKHFLNIDDIPIDSERYREDTFFIDLFSFVGVCLKTSLIKSIGLPSTDYFIQYDDTDYSLRVRKETDIICVSKSVVVHDISKTFKEEICWKTYYSIRNRLLLIKKFYPRRFFSFAFLRCYFGSVKVKNRLLKKIRKKAAVAALHNEKGKNIKYLPGNVIG